MPAGIHGDGQWMRRSETPIDADVYALAGRTCARTLEPLQRIRGPLSEVSPQFEPRKNGSRFGSGGAGNGGRFVRGISLGTISCSGAGPVDEVDESFDEGAGCAQAFGLDLVEKRRAEDRVEEERPGLVRGAWILVGIHHIAPALSARVTGGMSGIVRAGRLPRRTLRTGEGSVRN